MTENILSFLSTILMHLIQGRDLHKFLRIILAWPKQKLVKVYVLANLGISSAAYPFVLLYIFFGKAKVCISEFHIEWISSRLI